MFILIPEIVDQDHSLHPNAQKLCGYIIGLSNSKFGCLAKNSYFEKRLNVSLATVKRYLKDLKDKGYIEIEQISRDNKTTYRVIVPTPKVLVTMETSKKEINKKMSNYKNNKIPQDIECDWIDNFIDNL